MERTFVAWLESHGIQKGIYGYWDQVHFKHAPDGKMKNGWADFVFVSRRLVIELDGNHHKTRKHLDEIRDDHLSTRRGYKVIRITHTEYVKQTRLKQIESVLGI
jgi:very-short-patch-repair endonuclease